MIRSGLVLECLVLMMAAHSRHGEWWACVIQIPTSGNPGLRQLRSELQSVPKHAS